jgi:hypothetical protein
MAKRFPIRFDPWYHVLSSALLLPPSSSYVEVSADQVEVRMGWAFRARFTVEAVATTALLAGPQPLSRGVHGWAGRWLVNGSGKGIVVIDLSPTQRGWVMGFPVRLRQLMVSVEAPEGLRALLARKTASS